MRQPEVNVKGCTHIRSRLELRYLTLDTAKVETERGHTARALEDRHLSSNAYIHGNTVRTYGGRLITGIEAWAPKRWTKNIHAPTVMIAVAKVSKKLRARLNVLRQL